MNASHTVIFEAETAPRRRQTAVGRTAVGRRDFACRKPTTAGTAAVLLSVIVLCSCASRARLPDGLPPHTGTVSSWTGDPLVGTVSGYVLAEKDKEDTFLWRAIPYAAPPVGDLRWRAPREPEPWEGVRAPRRFSSPCTQFNPVVRGAVTGSEDCLYLNVWRPQGEETNLPVYVWIHGGGNSIGSATFVPDYYGHAVAARSKFVFVSINYRLGPFGWFAHPALQEGGSGLDASGNYGTLDIIKALEWIQDNISAFGGDPGHVLVSGESAGAINVLSLLLSPKATGLFHAALVQSGATQASSMEDAFSASEEVLAALLARDRRSPKRDTMDDESIRDYLRSADGRRILRSLSSRTAGMTGFPAVLTDGTVIPHSGFDAFTDGSYPNKVPVMIGSNSDETRLFLFLGGRPSWRTDLYDQVGTFGSLRWKADGVDSVARSLSAHQDQPNIYAYFFRWGSQDEEGRSRLPGNWGRRLGAFHTLEIPFFLGTNTVNGPVFSALVFARWNRTDRGALSQAMMRYVASFARTGYPSALANGLPVWRAWSNKAAGAKSLILDAGKAGLEIEMSRTEYSRETIDARMRRELTPEEYDQVRAFLDRNR